VGVDDNIGLGDTLGCHRKLVPFCGGPSGGNTPGGLLFKG
jgi:hypothetical protein